MLKGLDNLFGPPPGLDFAPIGPNLGDDLLRGGSKFGGPLSGPGTQAGAGGALGGRLGDLNRPLEASSGDPNGPFRGGRHGQTKLPIGDGLDSNHMPADSISPIPKKDGPAIQMEPADHKRMSSTGNSHDARAWREKQRDLINQGRFKEAQQMDIDQARQLFGDKYDEAIQEMLDYTNTLNQP